MSATVKTDDGMNDTPALTGRAPAAPLRLGVSSCLLGEPVRYDGADKRDDWIAGRLAARCECLSLCPEVGAGLGVPRPPVHLCGTPARPRALGVDDPALDVTERLQRYATATVDRLPDLHGYIFKSRSPSCGLRGVPVRGPRGALRPGRGLFAAALVAAAPGLPVAEEGDLAQPVLRDAFLEQAFARRRWQQALAGGAGRAAVERFHAAHRLLLLSHGAGALRTLDAVLAGTGGGAALAQAYESAFTRVLRQRATPRRQRVVLKRLLGMLEGGIDARLRRELETAWQDYADGRCGRRRLLALLQQAGRRSGAADLAADVYLWPDADEAALRDFL